MTTIEQLIRITAQYNEIVKRVGNGSLNPLAVKLALQDIIESKLPQVQDSNPPTWWRTPEQQLARARQLWPYTLPEPPKKFVPWTETEVLLLHVPDSFERLWHLVDAPFVNGVSYTKLGLSVKLSKWNLRLSPNKREFKEPVWLAFDPERGKGELPGVFWGWTHSAASEVLSALIQFPEWSLAWFNGASAPNLSGYQVKDDGTWTSVLCLSRSDSFSQLMLCVKRATYLDDNWSSPSVREC